MTMLIWLGLPASIVLTVASAVTNEAASGRSARLHQQRTWRMEDRCYVLPSEAEALGWPRPKTLA